MSNRPSTNSNNPGVGVARPGPWRSGAPRKLGRKVRVLIVDDSSLVRKVLAQGLGQDPGIEVVGVAGDPFVARSKILKLQPDVLTLDIEMPRMDGITFLHKLMTHYPLPVVVFSSLTDRSADVTLRALDEGAVDVMLKPDTGGGFSLEQMIRDLAGKVKMASTARLVKRSEGETKAETEHRPPLAAMLKTTEKVVAIGASTGGTQALASVMERMPADGPGILIVQHMPAAFTKSFAERLHAASAMEVREAREGDVIHQGLALVAPGNYHMVLRRSGARYYVQLNHGPAIHHQRPAVEALFRSVATAAAHNSVGVILTGMGSDGAEGMLAMRESGAHTIAQDAGTSIVYGMPKEAADKGAACEIKPLGEIARSILRAVG